MRQGGVASAEDDEPSAGPKRGLGRSKAPLRGQGTSAQPLPSSPMLRS